MKKWFLIILIIILFIFFGAPFVIYWRTGQYPKGFFLKTSSQNLSTEQVEEKTQVSSYRRQDINQFKKLTGFLTFYYDRDIQPDITKLAQWGGNAVNIIVEDAQEYQKQNEWLKSKGIIIPAGPSGFSDSAGMPFAPDEGAPERLNLESTVENLVKQAHDQNLIVKLSIPFTEKWLRLAEIWQVELISTMNDEGDNWLIPTKNQIGEAQTIELFNQYSSALLNEARRYFSNKIGFGFTNLLTRPTAQTNFFVDKIDLTNFDYISINPHSDPSMQGDSYINFISKSSQTARNLADRNKIKTVYLAALMVDAKSETVRGYSNRQGYLYSDTEEADFYQKLFNQTDSLLDGYFLQFSGWEDRPATKIIGDYYRLVP